jgi:excisionase family DNA binding protein
MKHLTLEQCAHRFGVHKETVRRWALTKVIPAYRIHKRGRWQFNPEEIDKFIAAQQSQYRPEQGEAHT